MANLCFVSTIHRTLKVPMAEYLYQTEGHITTFICDYDPQFEASLPPYLNYRPVNMKRGIHPAGLLAMLKMYRIFRKGNFDMVQYATPNASVYASIAAWLARVKKRVYYQWGIYYYASSGIKRRALKLLEKIACRFSTDVRPISFRNRDFSIREGLYSMKKCKVLGNGGNQGVDVAGFQPERAAEYRAEIRKQHGLSENDFLFGFVGRFSRDKGTNELLRALKNIHADRPVKFVCIGSDETKGQVETELLDWAKTCKDVIFTGRLPREEVVKYYAAMDCYVHPTYREGFSFAVQEAGAMGCAVIAADVPGSAEVLESACIAVPARDAQALETAMRDLMDHPEQIETLGEAALAQIRKYYDRPILLELQRQDHTELLASVK